MRLPKNDLELLAEMYDSVHNNQEDAEESSSKVQEVLNLPEVRNGMLDIRDRIEGTLGMYLDSEAEVADATDGLMGEVSYNIHKIIAAVLSAKTQ